MKLLITVLSLFTIGGMLAGSVANAETQLSAGSSASAANSGSSNSQIGVERGVVTIQLLGGQSNSTTASTSNAAGVAANGGSGSAATGGAAAADGVISAFNHAEGTGLAPVGDSGSAGSNSASTTSANISVATAVADPAPAPKATSQPRNNRAQATRPTRGVSKAR